MALPTVEGTISTSQKTFQGVKLGVAHLLYFTLSKLSKVNKIFTIYFVE
jgi:hypothetical protein